MKDPPPRRAVLAAGGKGPGLETQNPASDMALETNDLSGVLLQAVSDSSPGAGENASGLSVKGPAQPASPLKALEIKAFPHLTVKAHNGHTNRDETYSGIPLIALLAKVDPPLGKDLHGKALASYVVLTGSDGYKAVLSLAEVDPAFHPGQVLGC